MFIFVEFFLTLKPQPTILKIFTVLLLTVPIKRLQLQSKLSFNLRKKVDDFFIMVFTREMICSVKNDQLLFSYFACCRKIMIH